MIVFALDIVGGPFDGAPGLSWRDDGETPPPELIFVGVCVKGSHCGSSSCRRSARHVSFWTPDEERPTRAVSYAKENEFVERGEDDELSGRAVYAIGGLTHPRSFAGAEMVGAGAGPPITASMGRTLRWLRERGRPSLFPDGRHDRGWPR